MGVPLSASLRHRKKRAYLASFEALGNISAACRAAGIDRSTYRWWMEHDQDFALAIGIASEVATEHLEEEAHRRAVLGTEKHVHYQGARVDTVHEYSDVLLMFLLKARAPHKYRDNAPPDGAEPIVKVYAGLDLDAV